ERAWFRSSGAAEGRGLQTLLDRVQPLDAGRPGFSRISDVAGAQDHRVRHVPRRHSRGSLGARYRLDAPGRSSERQVVARSRHVYRQRRQGRADGRARAPRADGRGPDLARVRAGRGVERVRCALLSGLDVSGDHPGRSRPSAGGERAHPGRRADQRHPGTRACGSDAGTLRPLDKPGSIRCAVPGLRPDLRHRDPRHLFRGENVQERWYRRASGCPEHPIGSYRGGALRVGRSRHQNDNADTGRDKPSDGGSDLRRRVLSGREPIRRRGCVRDAARRGRCRIVDRRRGRGVCRTYPATRYRRTDLHRGDGRWRRRPGLRTQPSRGGPPCNVDRDDGQFPGRRQHLLVTGTFGVWPYGTGHEPGDVFGYRSGPDLLRSGRNARRVEPHGRLLGRRRPPAFYRPAGGDEPNHARGGL
ncbi:MAG: hypothetical protein AVDCRST_MAG03-749, partial [uncultured Rubrobacteraceae bacterium]